MIRLLTVRFVLNRMMRRAPVSVAEPAAQSPGPPPPGTLEFIESSAEHDVILEGDAQLRQKRVQSYPPTAIATVWIAGFLWFLCLTFGVNGQGWFALIFILMAGLFLAVRMTLRYFQQRSAPFKDGMYYMVFLIGSALAMVAIEGSWFLATVPTTIAGALLAWSFGRMPAAVAREKDRNVTLLVLRVFDADASTAQVFGALMKYWQHLGAHFTIVDPSYVRYQFSLSSNARRKLFRVLLLLGVAVYIVNWMVSNAADESSSVWAIAWSNASSRERQDVVSIMLWLAIIPIAIVPALRAARSGFVSDPATLERRIRSAAGDRGWARKVFAGNALYCYDDVWKRAVRTLLGASDVVLMDLRGFSLERRGCEYEIGELIDHFPLERVVFLVDEGTTKAQLQDLIKARWTRMSASSPNRTVAQPFVRIYVPKENDARDERRIFALLSGAAASADGMRIRYGPATPLAGLAKVKDEMDDAIFGFTKAFSKLDMLLVAPRYAKYVTPGLIVVVLGLFSWRMAPIALLAQRLSSPEARQLSALPPVESEPLVVQAGRPADARARGRVNVRPAVDACGVGAFGAVPLGVHLSGGESELATHYVIRLDTGRTALGASWRASSLMTRERTSITREAAGTEGFCAPMTVEVLGFEADTIPKVTGTIELQRLADAGEVFGLADIWRRLEVTRAVPLRLSSVGGEQALLRLKNTRLIVQLDRETYEKAVVTFSVRDSIIPDSRLFTTGSRSDYVYEGRPELFTSGTLTVRPWVTTSVPFTVERVVIPAKN